MSGIFDTIPAWFSSSCDAQYKQLWVEHGGTVVVDLSTALFIFSNDPKAKDTIRIFKSRAYGDGLTVVMAGYIDACLQVGDAHKIALSLYILHPPEALNEMRNPVESYTFRERNFSWSKIVRITDSDICREDVEFVPHIKDIPTFTGILEDVMM
ncbi:telomere repeats-binding bouquet formation protein 2-like isoform X2 [Antedon mediterranea]